MDKLDGAELLLLLQPGEEVARGASHFLVWVHEQGCNGVHPHMGSKHIIQHEGRDNACGACPRDVILRAQKLVERLLQLGRAMRHAEQQAGHAKERLRYEVACCEVACNYYDTGGRSID